MLRLFLVLLVCILFCSIVIAQVVEPAPAPPRLIRFSGTLLSDNGSPHSGTVGIIFAIYSEPQGGAPLWQEVQNVTVDAHGGYSVLLGSQDKEGLPLALFTSSGARWLGVTPEGSAEQTRVLLVSVPYALRALDAETLGGKPLSAFQLAPEAQMDERGKTADSPVASTETKAMPRVTSTKPKSTPNYLTKYTDNAGTIAESLVYDNGNLIGIGTTSPNALLEVVGAASSAVAGTNSSAIDWSVGVRGWETAGTGHVFGVHGSINTTGDWSAGVSGASNASSGRTFGVFGSNNSTAQNAAGVAGSATAATGQTAGVFGANSSSTDYAAGVRGTANADTGITVGVRGETQSTSDYAAGVSGISNAATGANYGVFGIVRSSTMNAAGVRGSAESATGKTTGVWGWTNSHDSFAAGVDGHANATTGVSHGVRGDTNSNTNGAAGVFGLANADNGGTIGVQGQVQSPNGTAGLFDNRAGGKILSGQNNGIEKFSVDSNGNVVVKGDFVAATAGSGIILRSPGGSTCARIGIDDNGNIVASSVPCPSGL